MNADPIPAVREDQATGVVADTFADLRQTLGIPFVNLIWRHLATVPNGLTTVWRLVRPIYAAPDFAQRTAALRDAVAWPDDLTLPSFVWESAGLGAADRAEIAALIADYNTGNSANLLPMLAADAFLRGETGSPVPPEEARPAQPTAASARRSRPLPALSALAPPQLALVMALDAFGRSQASDGVASLYRHLAHWPAFLALAYARLAPLHGDGRLRREQEALGLRGREIVRTSLIGRLDTRAVSFAEGERAFVTAALHEFTRLMIPRMVVIGSALKALLPDESAPA